MAGDLQVWRRTSAGLALRVRVTPKSSADAVAGLAETAEGPAVQVRVRAVPDEGKANAAVAAMVAKWLGVPGSTVSVARGHKSRVKTLEISGDPGALEKLAAAQVAALS